MVNAPSREIMLHHINTIAAFSEHCKLGQVEGPVQVLVLDKDQLAGIIPEFDEAKHREEMEAVISGVLETFFK